MRPESVPKSPAARRNSAISLCLLIILLLQIAGTLHHLPWTPGLLLPGGVERLLDFADKQEWAVGVWARYFVDGAGCGFWLVMLVASSPLGRDRPPACQPGERAYIFQQSRWAVLPALSVLLTSHAIGLCIASLGYWPLALPFELGGHVAMAVLLYQLLIPEGRRMLVLIESRCGMTLHYSNGFFGARRGWRSVRTGFLRGFTVRDPLWARVVNAVHFDLSFMDEGMVLNRETIRNIGTKSQAAATLTKINAGIPNPMMQPVRPPFMAPQYGHMLNEEL